MFLDQLLAASELAIVRHRRHTEIAQTDGNIGSTVRSKFHNVDTVRSIAAESHNN